MKNHKNFILTRTISNEQMTCCILPNHNVIYPVNRDYIEVEKINEKTLEQLKKKLKKEISLKLQDDIIIVRIRKKVDDKLTVTTNQQEKKYINIAET